MEFTPPHCWADDDRMNFLFQPFRERKLNPLSYDAKMSFWKEQIKQVLQLNLKSNIYTDPKVRINIKVLKTLFTRNGTYPKCLSSVVASLVLEKFLVEESSFQANLYEVISKRTSDWASWTYDMVVRTPVKLLLRGVSKSSDTSISDDASYISVDNITRFSMHVLKLASAKSQQLNSAVTYSRIFSHEEVLKLCTDFEESDINLALLWLEAGNLLYRIGGNNETLYKFAYPDRKPPSAHPPTELELGVRKLRASKEKLECMINDIEKSIIAHNKVIKENLKSKNRSLAMRFLRKRKLLEKKSGVYELHINRLESVLDEIDNSETNQVVCKAYEQGTKALTLLQKETPLESVLSVTEDLAEAIELSREISDQLSEPNGDDTVSTEDLERELESLIVKEDDIDDLLLSLDKLTAADELPSHEEPKAAFTKTLFAS